ncbi:MAG TPA: SDR family NAD(P)-dependent oxidoreductase [Pyrinomonadaceae bacterium]|nr:SDR family NAD(P)-dependent oxidoreductase [Pyrinomonadaceae bacterium]
MSSNNTNQIEGIAIIGMAGRFPGANNIAEYWHNLRDGVESIKFFSDEELQKAGIEASRLSSPNFVKAKGAIEHGDMFDAAFFGFTPREAEIMDPQHRLFMECVWTALEDSGYDPETYKGAIGLYGGEGMNSYLLLNLMSNRDLLDSVGLLQASVQNRGDHLTTHVAYELNLKGPSLTIQTACSTSLVAVHTACQSLLNFECDMALAGGVTITVPLKNGYTYLDGGIYSPDGHCRAFDAQAQGTVQGDGVAVIALKRLSDALNDGDTIHAVIRGSAVNNDGSLKVGYTAPSVDGQAEVIAEAHAVSGVNPETITYVETHGTGTALGDPVEVEALTRAFRNGTEAKRFCAIGAVKTNIGHLDAAAGVAGLIKTVLALKHRQLPPSLNFESENPRIDFANSPFYVNAELSEWKSSNGDPRRAGVSSFGIGGTNAHVVLEEAPEAVASESKRNWHLLPLAARTSTALDTATLNLHAYLKDNPQLDLADVAHTLQVGRKKLNHRRVVVCRDMEDAVRALDTLDARRVFTSLQEPKNRPVVFLFPGQGAQYVRMGLELYQAEPIFREQIDKCSEILKTHLGFDLRDVLYPSDEALDEAKEKLNQTFVTQPALFVTEYALAKQWLHWGVMPEAMIGHSIGEYVAACLAGVFSLEDALRLVALRGKLIQGLPSGSMLVVSLPEQKLRAMIESRPSLSIAAINSPGLCTVSGTHEAIDELEAELKPQGLMLRRLQTSHAFHSPMMEPILQQFVEAVSKAKLSAPSMPYLSNVTGDWIKAEEATDPGYYARHIRQTVLFNDGISEIFSNPERLLLEVGPGNTLTVLSRHHPQRGAAQVVLNSLRRADEQEPDEASMLTTLGRMWLANVNVDWEKLSGGERRRRISLPTYPFERQRYWVEAQAGGSVRNPLRKDPEVGNWFYAPSWRRAETPAAKHESKRRWLIFVDECGVEEQLSERLEKLGHEVIAVQSGEGFKRIDDQRYVIDPGSRPDYDALLKEIGAISETPQTILHLWNVTPEGQVLDVEDAQARGFYSLLFLAQALGDQLLTLTPADVHVEEKLNICVVSNNLQEVTGEEELCPEKATLLGPCRVISQEYQNILCRSIDVVVADADTVRRQRLVDDLLAEIASGSVDRVVAYRGRHRWVQDFEQIQIDAADEAPVKLKGRGVYLITGGMGGMGLEFAQYLAQTVNARLVLVGRTPLPADHEKIKAIEAAGGEVLLAAADVTNEEQMIGVVQQARERFGEINGVVHAAGVPGAGMIQLKTPAMAENVLAPKVAGTRVLDRVLQNAPLDFFIMCSSRAAILGGFGNVDYCAANAYLDAFAHYKRATNGGTAVSINWDAWQSVGMLVKSAEQAASKKLPARQPVRGNPASNGNGHHQNGHPLLHRAITNGGSGEEIYQTDFSVTEHWVLDDHRIVGAAVMPGTAYLEMARAAVEKRAGEGSLEIRDAFFLAPLALRDDEIREVRILIDENGGEYSYKVVSKPTVAENGEADEWQPFSIGKLSYFDADPPAREDLKSIIARCNQKEIVIRDDDEIDPDLGPRWQSLQRVYLGDKELLATLELPEMFEGDMDYLKLHPALLDRATGTAKHYLVNEGHYLPMGYKRLRIKGPLPRRIHAYIRAKDSGSRHETITFDITLFDEDGVERVVIDSFSQKRVNDATGTIKLLAGSGARANGAAENGAKASGAEAMYQRSLSEGIAPEEGVEVFRRILSANVPAQLIVSTKNLRASIEQVNSFAQTNLTNIADNATVARAAHARPADLQSPFVPPRNEIEQRLATIWQEMLGIEGISIHDNFFELGGDSVKAIQISVKINEAGLQFSPQQLFQSQTIAELAAILDPSQAQELAMAATAGANGSDSSSAALDQPFAGLSQAELEKIAMLLEETDQDDE